MTALLASFAAACVTERVLPWAYAARPEPPLGAGTFAQGVASGFPALHGATLWTRVEGVERSGPITTTAPRRP
jgi:phosphodiesterase/alkaline phosphatase D-like protein